MTSLPPFRDTRFPPFNRSTAAPAPAQSAPAAIDPEALAKAICRAAARARGELRDPADEPAPGSLAARILAPPQGRNPVRISVAFPSTNFQRPAAEELRQLRSLVLGAHPWLRDHDEQSFARAFIAVGYMFRTPAPVKSRHFEGYVFDANALLEILVLAPVDGISVMAAILGHADIVWQEANARLRMPARSRAQSLQRQAVRDAERVARIAHRRGEPDGADAAAGAGDARARGHAPSRILHGRAQTVGCAGSTAMKRTFGDDRSPRTFLLAGMRRSRRGAGGWAVAPRPSAGLFAAIVVTTPLNLRD